MGYEWIGYFLCLAVAFLLVGLALASGRLSGQAKSFLVLGLILHVVGAFLRYHLLYAFYNGSGDAAAYFQYGSFYASQFARLDFSAILNSDLWRHGSFHGTHFIGIISGFVILLIGPTMRGEFLLFSLFSFVGLVYLWLRVSRTHPEIKAGRYLLWLCIWPSLWYWPASLGKDALVLLGICTTVAGYVGTHGKVKWLPLIVGLTLVFAIRPQLAALVATALIMAQWLSFDGGWTPTKVVQGLLLLAGGIGVIWWGITLVGIQSFDVEGVQAYMERQALNTEGSGGSGIEAVGVRWYNAPVALITTLFRPFPWEAHNILALASSLEITMLWGLVWYWRKNVLAALKNWRKGRVLRFAIPFVLLYSILLGMSVANLGIVARQRIFIFPFLFLLLTWQDLHAESHSQQLRRTTYART